MRLFVLMAILCCLGANLKAQTFTEYVKQKKANQGVVTISQSKEISDLVNGLNNQQNAQTENKASVSRTSTETKVKAKEDVSSGTKAKETTKKAQDASKQDNITKKDSVKKEPEKKKTEPIKDNTDIEIPVVDMRKKVMVNSYKVNGYRVQAFAGGNSRKDRQQAENVGSKLKTKFPDEPVYVHFYSPRWICRIGNYRSYDEANRMLQKVKAMGFKQACLVKGKITVQN